MWIILSHSWKIVSKKQQRYKWWKYHVKIIVSLSLRLIQIPTTARPIALGETFSFKGTTHHAFSSALIPIWNLRISAPELRTRVTGGRKRVPSETKEFSSHKHWNASRTFEY